MAAATLVVALAIPGCKGEKGDPGRDGTNGTSTSCTARTNPDTSVTISCTDGTSATVTNGTVCTVTANADGSSTVTCGGTSTTVRNGESCVIVNNGNGTRTITCGNGTSVTIAEGSVDYQTMTATERAESRLTAVLTSVAIPADGRPVVTLKVSERRGFGVRGLSVGAPAVDPVSWRLALLKLTGGVNASANDTWVSYIADNDHTPAGAETALAANLTDGGDGTYSYRFAKVITGGANAAGTLFEAARPHRLVILLHASGNPFAPISLVKDFVPSTGADVSYQHDKVDPAACQACHTSFRAISSASAAPGTLAMHGGVRSDVRVCSACHNDQRRFDVAGALVTEPTFAADGSWTTYAGDGSATGTASVLNGEAILNFPVFIHKIHMGQRLGVRGCIIGDPLARCSNYAGTPKPYETTYPQDVGTCTTCHRAGPNALAADNWKTRPSRRACTACHDTTSFDAVPPVGRVAHTGGAQSDDTSCTLCHSAAAEAAGMPPGRVESSHTPVMPPDPNNIYCSSAVGAPANSSVACSLSTGPPNSNTHPAYLAPAGSVLPGAIQITYDVATVSVVTTTGASNAATLANCQPGLAGQDVTCAFRPQIAFKFKANGTDVVLPTPGLVTELIPNFVGGPSAYFSFAIPQDSREAPSDFNGSGSAYLRNIWNGTATCSNEAATTTRTGRGIVTGPDAQGYYRLTLTCVVIPARVDFLAFTSEPRVAMFTGGIGYTYSLGSRQSPPNPDLDFNNNNQPFTQINLGNFPYTPNKKLDGTTPGSGGVGGLVLPAPNVWKAGTGYAARRQIVSNAKCNACHLTLGVNPAFHGGQGNDATSCTYCHRPNQTSSGWSANMKDFVHAVHGSAKRVTPFTWHQVSATQGYWQVTYPAGLNKCSACHLEGPADRYDTGTALPAGQATYDFSTPEAQAALPNMLYSTVGAGTYAPLSVHSPYVNEGVAYGSGYAYTAVSGAIAEAANTTLVVSPFMAACAGCHDTGMARDHMLANGGSFYEARSTALTRPLQEQCMLCHGPNRLAAIALVHRDRTP